MSFPLPPPAKLLSRLVPLKSCRLPQLCFRCPRAASTSQQHQPSATPSVSPFHLCRLFPQHLPLGGKWGLQIPNFPVPQSTPAFSKPGYLALETIWPHPCSQKSSIDARRCDQGANQCILWQAPTHLALPTTNLWHGLPREQVLYISHFTVGLLTASIRDA